MSSIYNKRIVLNLLLVILFYFIGINIYSSKTYKATVVSLNTNTLQSGTDFSFYGIVEHTARAGDLIFPQITDSNGKVVKQGTVLIKLKQDYWQDRVLAAKTKLKGSKADLLTAKQNYVRYKTLASKGKEAVSIKQYQAVRSEYFDCISQMEADKAALLEAEEILSACIQGAPFAGIVDKVYLAAGRASGNPPTIEISQLNPIGIKIQMPRSEAKKIRTDSLVKITIPNSDVIKGINNGYEILCNDGIIVITENQLSSYNINKTYNGKPVPKVRNCYCVRKFYDDNPLSKVLCLPENTLLKDEKGYYVWKAVDRKFMQTDKRFDPLFKVSKCYVVPSGLKHYMGGFTKTIALKDHGDLELFDVVLSEIPSTGLKDGDMVYFIENKYLFMPGDTVNVSVDF